MGYCWGQTAAKKEMWKLWRAHIKQKKAVQLWQWFVSMTTGRCTLFLLSFLNLRNLFCVWIKLKKNIFKNNNQTNSTVTTRTGFFRKAERECFQVQDWYPNEKMVVVPVCLNVRCFDVKCCSSECTGVVSY